MKPVVTRRICETCRLRKVEAVHRTGGRFLRNKRKKAVQKHWEPKLFIQEINITVSQFEIQKKFPRESSFPLGYIWVAIFAAEVMKGQIKSITKKP